MDYWIIDRNLIHIGLTQTIQVNSTKKVNFLKAKKFDIILKDLEKGDSKVIRKSIIQISVILFWNTQNLALISKHGFNNIQFDIFLIIKEILNNMIQNQIDF